MNLKNRTSLVLNKINLHVNIEMLASLVGKVREILQSEETDKLVAKHVAAIFLRPEGKFETC